MINYEEDEYRVNVPEFLIMCIHIYIYIYYFSLICLVLQYFHFNQHLGYIGNVFGEICDTNVFE
jgi:hypothetical protein